MLLRQTVILPNASGRFTGAITQVNTQDSNTGSNAKSSNPEFQSASADMPTNLSSDEMIRQLQSRGYTITSPAPVEKSTPTAGKVIQLTPKVPDKPNRQRPNTQAETKSDTPPIVLSERARAVYVEWSKMPWFKGVSPNLTQTAAEHCETLTKYDPLPTSENMLKTRNWYEKKYPEKKGNGWYLGNFVKVYPDYLSAQYQSEQHEQASTSGYKPSNRILTNDELKKIAIGW